MSLRLRIILGYLLILGAAFAFVVTLVSQDIRPRYLEAVEESTVDCAELLAAMLAGLNETGGLNEMGGMNGQPGQNAPGLNPAVLRETLDTGVLQEAMLAVQARHLNAQIYGSLKRKVDIEVYVTDADGKLLYDSSGRNAPGADFSRWRDVHLTLRGQYGARSTRLKPSDPTSSVIYVAAPIIRQGGLAGVVTVGKPQDSVSLFIAIARKKLFSSLMLAALGALALGVAVSFWINRPLRGLLRYVQDVRAGKDARPPHFGRSELGELANALGEMRAELEGKNYIEDYVRALTHEMKSPLTGIKGAAEILRDEISGGNEMKSEAGERKNSPAEKFLDNIDADVERMQSLIDRMLQLSRLENVRSIQESPLHAKDFLLKVAQNFTGQAKKMGLQLVAQAPENTAFKADELLLGQALGNLIGNAIDFSPPGGKITLQAHKNGHWLEISVTDQGSGIPDFALSKVFDKFYSLARPQSGKKSSGLGLPFVREVMHLHNGEITLQNRAEAGYPEKCGQKKCGPETGDPETGAPEASGCGLTATLRLPL